MAIGERRRGGQEMSTPYFLMLSWAFAAVKCIAFRDRFACLPVLSVATHAQCKYAEDLFIISIPAKCTCHPPENTHSFVRWYLRVSPTVLGVFRLTF